MDELVFHLVWSGAGFLLGYIVGHTRAVKRREDEDGAR